MALHRKRLQQKQPAKPQITPSHLRTISSVKDTVVGQLEVVFTQFRIVSPEDCQQMQDKMLQQDNHLKVQKQSIEDLSSDLSFHIQSIWGVLSQQSTLIKKLQEVW